MQINTCNQSPTFGLIKLKPADLKQSETLLKQIAKSKSDIERKNSIALELYKIFVPYIQLEAILKAKETYILEEVFSDIKVKFWEFIYEITNKNVIDDLILKIDEYKPSKLISRLIYSKLSLDRTIPNTRKIKYSDCITSENLPIPQSEAEIKSLRRRLNTEINNVKMQKTSKQRLIGLSKGLTYRKIAEKEGVRITTVRNSVSRGILQIQKRNDVISEKYKKRISDLAELLGVTFEDVLDMVTKHIQILKSSNEVIERNIETFVKEFKISKAEFVKMALKQPALFCQKPETINKNIETSAKLFGVSKTKFISIALKKPQLFCQKPETLENKVKSVAELLEIPKEEVIKIIVEQPQLLMLKPETVCNNIETSAKILGISKADMVKSALQHPPLFYQSPQTLNNNVETAAKIFNISKEDYIKLVLKQPNLFSYLPQTLNGNVESITKNMKIPIEDYIKAVFKKPQLLILKPETICKNIETSAKLLGISKALFTKAALKQPQLFYQKPETINGNVETSARLLGIPKSQFVQMALKQLSLFYQKPETLSKKLKIMNYYKAIKEEPITTSITSRNMLKREEELYKDILVHIVQTNAFPKLTKAEIKTRLDELLKSCQNVITAEIIKFDLVDDFIKYAEKCSIEATGSNIFKFVIKE